MPHILAIAYQLNKVHVLITVYGIWVTCNYLETLDIGTNYESEIRQTVSFSVPYMPLENGA